MEIEECSMERIEKKGVRLIWHVVTMEKKSGLSSYKIDVAYTKDGKEKWPKQL